jgi:hypothetical protein
LEEVLKRSPPRCGIAAGAPPLPEPAMPSAAVLMRPAPARVVAEIKGLSLDDKLPILVRREGESLTGYRKVGAPGSPMEYAPTASGR